MNVVAHNIVAMYTQRQFKTNTGEKSKSVEKLSSGYRINRAGDDAAGLAISEKMRSQIRGLDKGEKNASDGISLLQVADGALTETISMMHRLTELSVQSANDTNTAEDRQQLQKEVTQILMEINRIADDTEFNTQKVFPKSRDEEYTPEPPAISNADIFISDMGKVADTGLLNRTSILSADSNGVTLDGETVAWEDMSHGSGANGQNTAIPFSEHGLAIFFEARDGATVDAMAEMLDGASFHIASNNDFTVSVSGGISDGSSRYDPGDYSWSLIDDTANDAVAKRLADWQGVSLDDVPLDISVGGEFSVYPAQKKAYFIPDGSSIQMAFSLDEAALNEWKAGKDTISAGDSIPVTYKYNVLGKTSTFSMDIIATEDVSADNLFNNTNPSDRFSLRISGISRGMSSSSITLSEPSDNTPGFAAEKKWWIQTSSNANEGFFINTGSVDTKSIGIDGIDISTGAGAQDAMERVRKGLDYLASQKGRLGAQTNRLEHVEMIDQIMSENTQSAESRIRDTDMGRAVVKYFKENILENAAESMLAQANQLNAGILELI